MNKTILKSIICSALVVTMLSGCGVKDAGNYDYADGANIADEKKTTADIYFAGDDAEFDLRPQDDFYGYVNAEELWNRSVPYNAVSTGTFEDVGEKVNEQIYEIIKEVIYSNEAYEKGSDKQIIRDYYNLCISGNYTDKAVFDEVINKIDSVKSAKDMLKVIGWLYTDYDVNTFFNIGVGMDAYDTSRNTLSLEDAGTMSVRLKDIYEDDDIATSFRDEMVERMVGYGVNKDDAEKLSESVVYLWLDIAYNTDFDALEGTDKSLKYNKYSVSELESLFTNLDVKELFNVFNLSDDDISKIDYLYVFAPEQLAAIDRIFVDENLDAIKTYCKDTFIANYDNYLPAEYNYGLNEHKTIDEDEAILMVSEGCIKNICNLYMDKYYTEEMDDYMQCMKNDITTAYVEMINDSKWLSDEGKKSMINKFNNISFYFGGDTHRSPDVEMADTISTTLLQTAINKRALNNRRAMEELYKAPDKSVWVKGATTVNAEYSPSCNAIYVTTAIMNAPFLDLNADYYRNLGGIGCVIGHELSHGFDSRGIQYDANGAYNPSWISKEDMEAFQKIVTKVEDHYDKYTILGVYHVDGKLTITENLADIGGVECILHIANNKDEYEQIFTGYAKTWATLYQNTNVLEYLKDVHSPHIVRVNAVLSCFDEFYETYDVKEGDGMYVAPEDRVVRW